VTDAPQAQFQGVTRGYKKEGLQSRSVTASLPIKRCKHIAVAVAEHLVQIASLIVVVF